MKRFKLPFRRFYKKKYTWILRFPTSKYLFKKEVAVVHSEFQKYLEKKRIKHKGLNKKMLLRLLAEHGHCQVSNKK